MCSVNRYDWTVIDWCIRTQTTWVHETSKEYILLFTNSARQVDNDKTVLWQYVWYSVLLSEIVIYYDKCKHTVSDSHHNFMLK